METSSSGDYSTRRWRAGDNRQRSMRWDEFAISDRERESWVFLDCNKPVDGGAVAAYKIQSRLRSDGPWTDAGMAIESEIARKNQERGKEWEYHVFAVNKAGEGEHSNTVMAVL